MGKVVISKRKRNVSGSSLFEEKTQNLKRDLEKAVDDQSDLTDSKTSSSEQKGGKTGTMRVTKDGDLYYLEIKTADGWVISDNTSVSGFKFKKN
jgi:hypothetical protein|tara:strand:- start:29 stop:310 length:282 start_codon:yes stop_codon:yes gene_type:complete